jgi:hypothetical protein
MTDDMYALWNLLLRGPVTRKKLPGSAREWDYYVLAILSSLPYVRSVEIARPDKVTNVAIELASGGELKTLPAAKKRGQGEFIWA